MDKYFIIYKTTNLLNGRYYIGMHVTTNINDGYLGSGRRIKAEIKKYGRENFSRVVLAELSSKTELAEREASIVTEELRSDPLCLNLKNGGEGGGRIWSDEHFKAFQSRAHVGGTLTGHKHSTIGRAAITPEHRRTGLKTRVGNGNPLTTSGLVFSKETRRQMSASSSGDRNSQFGTCWVHRNGQAMKVKSIDLQSFLNQGFSRGRK